MRRDLDAMRVGSPTSSLHLMDMLDLLLNDVEELVGECARPPVQTPTQFPPTMDALGAEFTPGIPGPEADRAV